MKKPLFLAIGAGIAALAYVPVHVGNQLESKLQEAIDSVNALPVYSAELISYNKNWFTTEATITLAFDMSSFAPQLQANGGLDTPENPSITLSFSGQHGLIFSAQEFGLGLLQYQVRANGDDLRKQLDWEQGLPLYQLKGVLGLTNKIAFTDTMPKVSYINQDSGVEVVFSGYDGRGAQSGEEISYTSSMTNLSISDDEMAVSFDGFDMNATFDGSYFKALAGELLDSTFTLSLASLKVSSQLADSPTAAIDNIVLSTESKVDEAAGTADVTVNYSVASFSSDDFEGTDFALGLALNNLDLAFVKEYQELSNELLTQSPEVHQSKLMEFVESRLIGFLAASPELNITQFKGTLPQGNFDAHLNTKLVDIDAMPAVLDDPGFWLAHLLADAKLVADQPLAVELAKNYMVSQIASSPDGVNMTTEEIENFAAAQAPSVLNMFSQQGFIVNSDDQYRSEFELKEGKAMLNGTPIPLPVGG